MTRRSSGLARVFAFPLAIAFAAFAGLVLGLTGEGARDVASWLLVGLAPVFLCLAMLRRPRRRNRI